MAFTKFVQTADHESADGNTYKIELFIDSGSPPTLRTLDFKGLPTITTGKSSTKTKFDFIKSSKAEIVFHDQDRWLYDILVDSDDLILKGIIYQNSTAIFTGLVTAQLQKTPFTESLNLVTVTIYDGITRLKEYDDITALPSGKASLTDIFRGILDSLGYYLYIDVYMNVYPYPSSGSKAPDLIGIELADFFAIKEDLTYYDILEYICKTLQFSFFQENNVWVFQHLTSMAGSPKKTRIDLAGSTTYSTSSVETTFALEDVAYRPPKFNVPKIDTILIKVPAVDAGNYKQESIKRRENLLWLNPLFKEGSTGWTVSGTATFKTNSVQVQPGSLVFQMSEAIDSGQKVEVLLNATMIHYMIDDKDAVFWTPLFSIWCYEDTDPLSVARYWNFSTQTWEVFYDPNVIYYAGSIDPRREDPSGAYIEEYVSRNFEVTAEFTIPAFPTVQRGRIEVHLAGGATPNQTKPFNISAQHNYAILRLKYTNDVEKVAPQYLRVEASTSASMNKVQEIEIPFHDEDAYVRLHFWNMYNSLKTVNWYPDIAPLLDRLSIDTLRFNYDTKNGLDLVYLHTKEMKMINLHRSSIAGDGTLNYLPVFKEWDLLKGRRRFILIEHNKNTSITVNSDMEYVFSDE